MTLEEARTRYLEEIKKGSVCPCCDRYGKIYKQSIHFMPAMELLVYYRYSYEHGFLFHHVNDVFRSKYVPNGLFLKGSDIGKCARLGLVEEKEKEPGEHGKTSGMWKVTSKGTDFAENRITVPKYYYIYNREVVETEGPEISIVEALQDRFDYDDMMAGYLEPQRSLF